MTDDFLTDLWRWVLLDGDRNLLAGLLSAAVFLACLGAVTIDLVTVENARPIRTFLSAHIGGMVSFITIVVAIDQLILTEEFGTMGAFQSRLSETRRFRNKVERDADLDISPVNPSEFLNEMLETILEYTERLERVENTDDRLVELAEDLGRNSEQARERLDKGDGTPFELVSVILDYDADLMLHRLRELQATGDPPNDSNEMIENIASLLKDVHVTGLYFKTVNVQQELADVSKLLLSVGTVSLLYNGFVIISYENILATDPGRTILTLIVCFALSVAFAPFAVLLSHILRIATVARRTSSDFGPFLLQEQIPDEE